MEPQRIQKLISESGYTSRRKAEDLIVAGQVKVNGVIITELGTKATWDDKIEVEGHLLSNRQKLYFLMNKPKKYLSAVVDENKRCIVDLVPTKERLFPVGRLDFMTEGLIILTNDGEFANKVMHPRYGVSKTYYVFLDRELTYRDEEQITVGLKLKGGYAKGKIKFIKNNHRMFELELHEGRKHIVRRIFGKLGYQVMDLKRIKIGSVSIGSLEPGKYRPLKSEEIKALSNVEIVSRPKFPSHRERRSHNRATEK